MHKRPHDGRNARWRGGAIVGFALAILLGGIAVAAMVSHVASLVALALALIGLIEAYRRIDAWHRSVIALLPGDDAPPRTLPQALARLSARLERIGHRADARNPVTGLPTREFLFEAIASGPPGALLAILHIADVGRLSAFDAAAAGRLMTELCDRTRAAMDRAHILAQIDRDVLAIWFRNVDEATARQQLSALGHIIEQETQIDGRPLRPTLCIATVVPDAGDQDGEKLLAIAQARMAANEVDAAGPAAADAASAIEERFHIEQALQAACDESGFTAVFQPVIDARTGEVVSAEALLRWTHATLGAISPARFIPISEEAGLSDRIGLWMLNTACREVRGWRDARLPSAKVAVNLSACQLADPLLPEKIMRILDRHRLPASALELELTETAAMADIESTRRLFGTLRDLGLGIALDDFGAGYSSLSYLKNLRFDKLKIDREFVTDVHLRRDSRAICRALIELSRGLDLAVLAEGVESPLEVAALRELGCSLFQGFHFSRPLPPSEFRAFAATGVAAATVLPFTAAPQLRTSAL